MVLPGYATAWAFNLLDFRHRRAMLRFSIAIATSISVFPMLSYLLARFALPALAVFYAGVFLAGAILLLRATHLERPSRYGVYGFAVVCLWFVVVVASSVDVQVGDRLYLPFQSYDHCVRVEVMSAAARGLPPHNPFLVNPHVALRYHYLWMFFCALPLKAAGWLSPRDLTYASVFWSGVGLMSLIVLGVKFLLGATQRLERVALFAVGLLCVSGLDILPTIYLRRAYKMWLPDIDWWNFEQVTTWPATLLWVPHNLAALIACFVALILLRYAAASNSKQALSATVVAGCALASAAGLSVYVAFTFAIALAAWIVILWFQAERREAMLLACAGLVGLAIAAPYLYSLIGHGAHGSFLQFAVRTFPVGFLALRKLGLNVEPWSTSSVANALFLPLQYFLEFGFYLAVLVVFSRRLYRKQQWGRNAGAMVLLIGVAFAVGTFIRSSTIVTNDLGMRSFLPAQFILLLWGATLVEEQWTREAWQALRGRARTIVVVLLVLGLAGTAYELYMLRMFRVRYGFGGRNVFDEPQTGRYGKRAFALRSLYGSLDAQLPRNAVIQNNPSTSDYVPHLLYSQRDFAAAGNGCGVAFGGDPGECDHRRATFAALFEKSTPAEWIKACRSYGVDAVIVEETDGIWRDRSSWVWNARPAVDTPQARAFLCDALVQEPGAKLR